MMGAARTRCQWGVALSLTLIRSDGSVGNFWRFFVHSCRLIFSWKMLLTNIRLHIIIMREVLFNLIYIMYILKMTEWSLISSFYALSSVFMFIKSVR